MPLQYLQPVSLSMWDDDDYQTGQDRYQCRRRLLDSLRRRPVDIVLTSQLRHQQL